MTLVLASGSKIRGDLLRNAGLRFEVDPADVDERSVEAPLLESGVSPEDLALILAEAKADNVSERRPADLVIGADQVLALGDQRYTKPEDMAAARRQLLELSGQTHELISAVVLSQNGKAIWRHSSVVRMKMRSLSPEYIGQYLADAGPDILNSVGGYQLEGIGVQLFEEIEGDYFTVLGLPLLPLLSKLRDLGVLEA